MTSAVAPLLSLTTLSDDERATVNGLLAKLGRYQATNQVARDYYDGRQLLRNLQIAVPDAIARMGTVVGWPATTVDVLEERLDWFGWTTDADDDHGLGDIYADNGLDVESGGAHHDALMYGMGFVSVGTGSEGEPSPLITIESPFDITADWNPRTRRLDSAVTAIVDDGRTVEATLYLPDETVTAEPSGGDLRGVWTVTNRDRHNLGRVPVVPFPNRSHGAHRRGRSEITAAVRYYTDAAVRTMLGMEINREFYSAPQRYALGVDESAFVDADGKRKTGWETIMGRVWAIPRDENDELPTVGQFQPAPPSPYLDQVRGLAQLLAAEVGIPAAYLGFSTDNPASADAIRAGEARLVKRAERRQKQFGRAWMDVARLALLVRDGVLPDDLGAVSTRWADAATPTRAASADEAVKLITAQVLPPDSTVTYDRLGLNQAEQRQLAVDNRRARGSQVLAALKTAAAGGASGSGGVGNGAA